MRKKGIRDATLVVFGVFFLLPVVHAGFFDQYRGVPQIQGFQIANAQCGISSNCEAVSPSNLLPGLWLQSYKNIAQNNQPNYNTVIPYRTNVLVNAEPWRISNTVLRTGIVGYIPTNYGLRYSGYIQVPTSGLYTFYIKKSFGAKLYIANALVVTHNGQWFEAETSGTIRLAAGKHRFVLTHGQEYFGENLQINYDGPGISKREVPANVLFHVESQPMLRHCSDELALVAYWPLIENANDFSRNNYHGEVHDVTFSDGVSVFPGSVAYQSGGQTRFRPAYIDVSNAFLPNHNDPRTVCGWAMTKSTGGQYGWMISYGNPQYRKAISMGRYGSTIYAPYYQDGSRASLWDENVWNHFCMTHSGSATFFYWNGVKQAPAIDLTLTQTDTQTYEAFLGKQVGVENEGPWVGNLNHIMVFDREFSGEEISYLYRRGRKPYCLSQS